MHLVLFSCRGRTLAHIWRMHIFFRLVIILFFLKWQIGDVRSAVWRLQGTKSHRQFSQMFYEYVMCNKQICNVTPTHLWCNDNWILITTQHEIGFVLKKNCTTRWSKIDVTNSYYSHTQWWEMLFVELMSPPDCHGKWKSNIQPNRQHDLAPIYRKATACIAN